MSICSSTESNLIEERGASSTLGVLIMVGVAVLLASIGGVTAIGFMDFMDDFRNGVPSASFSVSADADDNTVKLTHVGGDAIDSAETRIIIANSTTRQTFEPTSTGSLVSPAETATIDLSLTDGNNRVNWNPETSDWEYEQPGSFSSIATGDELTLYIINAGTKTTIFKTAITADGSGSASTPDPSDPGHAYVDTNGNGEWDVGVDVKIDDAELADGRYDAGSNALVIPESVGPITASRISFDGSDITIRVDLTAIGNHDVSVTAGSGILTIENVAVDSKTGRQITLRGEAGVRANGTTIDSGAAITVKSNSGEVHLSNGVVDSTDTSGVNVQLTSNGDMYLESTTIATTAGGAATADLQVGDSSTLYIDAATINDGDDTLVYSPEDITIDGSPSSGSVAAN